MLIGCSTTSGYKDVTQDYADPPSRGNVYNQDYQEEPPVVENPYDEDSGHGAGYKWAEENGGDCDGNSESFNEGCEEYYQQADDLEQYEDENPDGY